MTCTFFGHKTVPPELKQKLVSTIINLIDNHNVTLFYVGNNGGFDIMVANALRDLSKTYPIKYRIVLAYIPKKQSEYISYDKTIIPYGIESVTRRFAIIFRNRWMLRESDYVVTYVTEQRMSGAAKFKELSEKQKKIVINLTL